MKKQRRWEQMDEQLAPDHGYRAKPGSKVFVIDRGAVRFDLPGEWIVTPKESSCVLKTPEDDCMLEISHFTLPPIDRSGLSLTKLLQDVTKIGGHRTAEDQIVHIRREDMEIAWAEHTYIDPSENREAILRNCIACGLTVHIVISYAFWPECRERFHEVWEEILSTLQLGHYFADPRVGPRLQ
jgi:hypothetical protein